MITPGLLLALFLALCAAGIVTACVLPERRQSSALAWLASAASLAALLASVDVLLFGGSFELRLWPLMGLGPLALALDPLSAVFVLTVGLVFLPVSIFSASYMEKYQGKDSLRYFSILYYLFLVSLVFVMVSYDVLLFMIAWEVMSVVSYLLVSYELRRTESARAGFLMLAMSEAGAIAMVLAFAILVNAAGRLDFPALRSATAALAGSGGLAVFLLSFFGFAVKAGLLPLNSWLPRAHPVAPTNVSALLSGVMVNLGIYGIVRINADLLPVADVGRGLLVLAIGSLSALVGILYATIENDLKRLLALVYAAFRVPTWRRAVLRGQTWSGGLRWLRPQQVYTATGFANPVRVIFHAVLRPATVEDSTEAVALHFRTAVRREYEEVHVIDRLILQPTVVAIQRLAGVLRRMHIGQVNAYAGYVLVMALLVLLLGRGHDILLRLATGLGIR